MVLFNFGYLSLTSVSKSTEYAGEQGWLFSPVYCALEITLEVSSIGPFIVINSESAD